jgi:hypothetical protein
LGWSQSEKEKVVGDGPVVVHSGGGGATAIALIVAAIAVVVLLFMFGVIDFGGGSGSDINVKVDAPAVQAPADPAPAPAAPANGGRKTRPTVATVGRALSRTLGLGTTKAGPLSRGPAINLPAFSFATNRRRYEKRVHPVGTDRIPRSLLSN